MLLNNIVNIALLLVVLYICDCWFALFDWPAFDIVLLMAGMAFAMLLFCETLPKVLVQGKQLGFVRWFATFMRVMERLLRPATRLLLSSSSLMSRWVAKKKEGLSMDGLSKALEMETSGISEEKEMLVFLAKRHDMNISSYVRNMSLKGSVVTKTDIQTVIELKRIGNNLNQIAKQINLIPHEDNIKIHLQEIHDSLNMISEITKKLV